MKEIKLIACRILFARNYSHAAHCLDEPSVLGLIATSGWYLRFYYCCPRRCHVIACICDHAAERIYASLHTCVCVSVCVDTFTCGVSNKSRTHAAREGEGGVGGAGPWSRRRWRVYDLLSWINVYDMKMSRNLVWLIKKATARAAATSGVLGSNFVEAGVFQRL